jgi:hypothetical protein
MTTLTAKQAALKEAVSKPQRRVLTDSARRKAVGRRCGVSGFQVVRAIDGRVDCIRRH